MMVDELLDGVDMVIVDWDGTVVDSQQANYTAINEALRPYGLTIDLAWYRLRAGLSIADLLTEITVVHGDLPTNEIISASRQQQLASLNQLRPIPATIELLDAAKTRGPALCSRLRRSKCSGPRRHRCPTPSSSLCGDRDPRRRGARQARPRPLSTRGGDARHPTGTMPRRR